MSTRAAQRAPIVGSALLLLAIAGCPQPAPPTNYFETPFFQFTTTNSACIRTVAVDGFSQGWQQDQCRNEASGFVKTRVLTLPQFAQVETAFAALPPQPDPACANNFLPGGTITYLRRGDGTTDITWPACVSGEELVQPYLDAVNVLKQYAETP